MKRVLLVFCVFLVLIAVVGCENSTVSKTISDSQSVKSKDTQNKKITIEELDSNPQTTSEEFEFADSNDTIQILDYIGTDTIVTVPDSINGKLVNSIRYAFTNDCGVVGVKIPDSIVELTEGVFGNNKTLSAVIIGNGIEILPRSTFLNCENLEQVKLNNGLKSIDDICFSNCKRLKKIYIPESVEKISGTAFFNVADDFSIEGKAGSYAEDYAREANIPFEAK